MGTDGPEVRMLHLSDILKQLHRSTAPSISGGNVDVPMIWTGHMAAWDPWVNVATKWKYSPSIHLGPTFFWLVETLTCHRDTFN